MAMSASVRAAIFQSPRTSSVNPCTAAGRKKSDARTNGAVRMSAGTLYRSLQRMVEQGLIEECDARPAPALDDERRRYYRLTGFGLDVTRAETERLEALVRIARAHGVIPRRA